MQRSVKVLFFLSVLIASSVFSLDTGDRDSISKIVDHFTHAWNRCEGKGSADYYAEDADFVNIFGNVKYVTYLCNIKLKLIINNLKFKQYEWNRKRI